MKNWLATPVAMAVVAAVGWAVCQAAGWDPHRREMILAVVVTLLATTAAGLPLRAARQRDQLAVAQLGLVAITLQLLVAIGLSAGLSLGRFGLQQAFLYWMLGFYWPALVVLVMRVVQQVKAAPPVTVSKQEP